MTVYLMYGLAFAGKSTLAAAISRRFGATVVSLDALNAARGLEGGLGIPDEEWAASHRAALARLADELAAGRDVIVDDTNCFRFLRDAYRAVAGDYGARGVVVHVDVSLALALARAAANDEGPARARVTESVLRELATKLEPPEADETTVVFRTGDDPAEWLERELAGFAGADPSRR